MTTTMKLNDLYRAGDVDRWQIVKTLRKQSIAEHSFHVAIISMRLYDDLMSTMSIGYTGENWNPLYEKDMCLRWALLHDTPEVLTGDVATPFKLAIKKAGVDPFSLIEGATSDEYRKLRNEVKQSRIVGHIVKMADMMESIKYLELNACTTHGNKVQAVVLERFLEYLQEVEKGVGVNMFKWRDVTLNIYKELMGDFGDTTLDDVLGGTNVA